MDMYTRKATLESLYAQLQNAEELKAKILDAISETKRRCKVGKYDRPMTQTPIYYIDPGATGKGRYKNLTVHSTHLQTVADTELKHKNNNCFLTEECARHAYQAVLDTLLTERFRELSKNGFYEDWEQFDNGNSKKPYYYIIRNKNGKYRYMYSTYGPIVGATPFPSEECAKAVCESMNEQLNGIEVTENLNANAETDKGENKAA